MPVMTSSGQIRKLHLNYLINFVFQSKSLEEETTFDPFSPRSLTSKQKEHFDKLGAGSALAELKPDDALRRQYAMLYGETKTKISVSSTRPAGMRKPTVIRPTTTNNNKANKAPSIPFEREGSPPEPKLPPPAPPPEMLYTTRPLDMPPALPPRRPHSADPLHADEPHAIVLFDYEKSHADDLACMVSAYLFKIKSCCYTSVYQHTN
jgi:hypothetical protein